MLSFASLSLRPAFLSLLETHVATLNAAALRPALKALILCLLPGLEEENSEDFDRAFALVDLIKEAVNTSYGDDLGSQGFGNEFFWQCFFLASISARSRRQGALIYLSRRLPRLASIKTAGNVVTIESVTAASAELLLSPAAESVVAPEPGLLIRCFAAGLEDDQLLVQRGFLDLLLSHLPLNSPVLTQRVSAADLERLVRAATAVVLRKDMSLNRRLWSWFIGPEAVENQDEVQSPSVDIKDQKITPSGINQPHLSYFKKYGSKALRDSIITATTYSIGRRATDMAKPFRVCLSLMDRAEIGTILVPQILEPAMVCLRSFQNNASPQDFADVLRSARSFFDGIDGVIIWSEIGILIKTALDVTTTSVDRQIQCFDLVRFILLNFNVREEDMLAIYLPEVTVLLMDLLDARELSTTDGTNKPGSKELTANSLDVLAILVSYLGKNKVLNQRQHDSTIPEISDEAALASLYDFYTDSQKQLGNKSASFNHEQIFRILLSKSTALLVRGMQLCFSDTIELRTTIWTRIMSVVPTHASLDPDLLVKSCWKLLERDAGDKVQSTPFSFLKSITGILAAVCDHLMDTTTLSDDMSRIFSRLIEAFWYYLDPAVPIHHIEAVQCLWQLEDMTLGDHIVEASITRAVAGIGQAANRQQCQLNAAKRFSVFWNHSIQSENLQTKSKRSSTTIRNSRQSSDRRQLYRPLLLLLDALDEPSTRLSFFVRTWIKTLPSVEIIIDRLVTRIARIQQTLSNDKKAQSDTTYKPRATIQANSDTRPELVRYLQYLQHILEIPSENIWAVFVRRPRSEARAVESDSLQQRSRQICLSLLQNTGGNATGDNGVDELLQHHALAITSLILKGPEPLTTLENAFDETLVEILAGMLENPAPNLQNQVALLDILLLSMKRRTANISKLTMLETYPRSPGSLYLPPSSFSVEVDDTSRQLPTPNNLNAGIIRCIQTAVESPLTHPVLDHWIYFLVEMLPSLGDFLFQVLIPTVDCFCRQIRTSFRQLNMSFATQSDQTNATSESALIALLTGFEHLLAAAHNQLEIKEAQSVQLQPTESTQGFFGNVVSGVFTSESQKGRSAVANTRLTVLLCFQDAVRICLSIWSWQSQTTVSGDASLPTSASFTQVSLRLRNKTRRMLDRMISTEPSECLETLITASSQNYREQGQNVSVVSLLNALDGTRPKLTMPSIFNSIHTRSSPSSLDTDRVTTFASELSDIDLGQFMLDYTESLDADALDEIWGDCMSFMRDVLSNPLLHNNILPYLLTFLLILGEKMDHTNFGDQRKMRRELGVSSRISHANILADCLLRICSCDF